ncbi:MAG: hypothetical protein V4531_08480 [Actinomycetota bacterium]
MPRPTNGPIWPTHKRKSRQQHSRKPLPEVADDTESDLATIARDLYRAGKIPASMLDFIATNRTRQQHPAADTRMENN